MTWKIEFYNDGVYEDLHSMPEDVIAGFIRIGRLIEIGGPHKVHEPYVKHLQSKLWEMRLSGKDGTVRAIYITSYEKRVVIVNVFRKKTQKTPRREIEIALRRAREIR